MPIDNNEKYVQYVVRNLTHELSAKQLKAFESLNIVK